MTARIRCINVKCTCGRKLGKFQGEIELRLISEKISDILDSKGFTKMCCRISLLHPTTYPFIDSSKCRIVVGCANIPKLSRISSPIDSPEIQLFGIPNLPR